MKLCFRNFFTLLVGFTGVLIHCSKDIDKPTTDDLQDELPSLTRVRRIINGDLSGHEDHKWLVSISSKTYLSGIRGFGSYFQHFCGGTLIDARWLVTAAHCLHAEIDEENYIELHDPKIWHVRLGTGKLKPSFTDKLRGLFNRIHNHIFGYTKAQTFYHVKKLIIHPDYREGLLENDIALMKLKENILVDRMELVDVLQMPSNTTQANWPEVGMNCTSIGWGCSYADGPPVYHAREVILPILSPEDCRKIYSSPINLTISKEFCAGYAKKDTGICPGDSGGPIVCNYMNKLQLAGIVSATHGRKPESFPAVFTRVSYFIDWIQKTIKDN